MYWALWWFPYIYDKTKYQVHYTYLKLHDFNAVEMIFFIMTVYIFSKRAKVCKELLTKGEKYFLRKTKTFILTSCSYIISNDGRGVISGTYHSLQSFPSFLSHI